MKVGFCGVSGLNLSAFIILTYQIKWCGLDMHNQASSRITVSITDAFKAIIKVSMKELIDAQKAQKYHKNYGFLMFKTCEF